VKVKDERTDVVVRLDARKEPVGFKIVRIVPEVFTRRGNVMAFAERLDGKPFPDVNKILVGDTEIDFTFSAPDGRLYFFPPSDGSDLATTGSLPETGDPFKIEQTVRYTDETKASTESLRRQMAALRQCAEQFAKFARQRGLANQASSLYCVVLGDGHLRLADALDRIGAGGKSSADLVTAGPAEDRKHVDTLLDALAKEHRPAVDQFIAANPPTK
jgi:hypothetical protein